MLPRRQPVPRPRRLGAGADPCRTGAGRVRRGHRHPRRRRRLPGQLSRRRAAAAGGLHGRHRPRRRRPRPARRLRAVVRAGPRPGGGRPVGGGARRGPPRRPSVRQRRHLRQPVGCRRPRLPLPLPADPHRRRPGGGRDDRLLAVRADLRFRRPHGGAVPAAGRCPRGRLDRDRPVGRLRHQPAHRLQRLRRGAEGRGARPAAAGDARLCRAGAGGLKALYWANIMKNGLMAVIEVWIRIVSAE
ncbi:hypothetical protein MTBUT4_150076 [Magnetospirillum sp. UT-4]|nr:hypothetical protein MTBUT4_150076 [Magnetospirillum sp. UT-4]